MSIVLLLIHVRHGGRSNVIDGGNMRYRIDRSTCNANVSRPHVISSSLINYNLRFFGNGLQFRLIHVYSSSCLPMSELSTRFILQAKGFQQDKANIVKIVDIIEKRLRIIFSNNFDLESLGLEKTSNSKAKSHVADDINNQLDPLVSTNLICLYLKILSESYRALLYRANAKLMKLWNAQSKHKPTGVKSEALKLSLQKYEMKKQLFIEYRRRCLVSCKAAFILSTKSLDILSRESFAH
jgi:hypothetical protein